MSGKFSRAAMRISLAAKGLATLARLHECVVTGTETALAVARLVGIEGGVVSEVFNLERRGDMSGGG